MLTGSGRVYSQKSWLFKEQKSQKLPVTGPVPEPVPGIVAGIVAAISAIRANNSTTIRTVCADLADSK